MTGCQPIEARVLESLPARGAWIEMQEVSSGRRIISRRSPQGERGLKYSVLPSILFRRGSLPARGAWIEMSGMSPCTLTPPSLPARGAWIEIDLFGLFHGICVVGAVKKQQKIFHSPRFNREKLKGKEKRRKDPLTPNEAALGGLKLRAFFLPFCCSTYRDCAR